MFTLSNTAGMQLTLLSVGACIQKLTVPDKDNISTDIVLGYDDPAPYITSKNYLGVVVGRCANRIHKGRFKLNGRHMQVIPNEGSNHLHGGPEGFSHKRRQGTRVDAHAIRFTLHSPDGDQGYQGNLEASVTYTLTEKNEVIIEYRATSDQDTIVNMTHHSYFNLPGQRGRSIEDHRLTIAADRYTPVNRELIPTGDILSVENTPPDFQQAVQLGDMLHTDFPQTHFTQGIDHNLVFKSLPFEQLKAALRHEGTGIQLNLYTDQPGMQVYTGNFPDGSAQGKNGINYPRFGGLCLETQGFPDAPNHPAFPSTLLEQGTTYKHTTRLQIGLAQSPIQSL